jgi:His-Xaa-Ser system radical SAM maturase HxsC
MLKLSVPGNTPLRPLTFDRPAILKVTTNLDYPVALRNRACLLADDVVDEPPTGFGLLLARNVSPAARLPESNVLRIGADLHYLSDGDVIKAQPSARITTIYRRSARANALLVTERCNSFCVMCSQPPRLIDDDYLIDDYLEAIPFFDRSAREIGITGGEPTLLGNRLFTLLNALKAYLPETAVHILSNGRNCRDLSLCQRFGALGHPDLMLGIPLYSDISSIHDFVVQADGAYDETMRGILNLKRCGVPVEIRVVIHRHTYARLPAFARFIARNLQFVDHVALMGLELMGFAKSNLEDLWIDPVDYQPELVEATLALSMAHIRTSIYNHQLCLLDPSIRRFAVKSISDWKNEYMPECSGCELMSDCGGFFSSASLRRSNHIQPVKGPAARASPS